MDRKGGSSHSVPVTQVTLLSGVCPPTVLLYPRSWSAVDKARTELDISQDGREACCEHSAQFLMPEKELELPEAWVDTLGLSPRAAAGERARCSLPFLVPWPGLQVPPLSQRKWDMLPPLSTWMAIACTRLLYHLGAYSSHSFLRSSNSGGARAPMCTFHWVNPESIAGTELGLGIFWAPQKHLTALPRSTLPEECILLTLSIPWNWTQSVLFSFLLLFCLIFCFIWFGLTLYHLLRQKIQGTRFFFLWFG